VGARCLGASFIPATSSGRPDSFPFRKAANSTRTDQNVAQCLWRPPSTADLHWPWPTSAEELAAEHIDGWEIYRDVARGGVHGDWIAKRWPTAGQQDADRETVPAPTIDGLRALLRDRS
jgi:hypothetical protein